MYSSHKYDKYDRESWENFLRKSGIIIDTDEILQNRLDATLESNYQKLEYENFLYEIIERRISREEDEKVKKLQKNVLNTKTVKTVLGFLILSNVYNEDENAYAEIRSKKDGEKLVTYLKKHFSSRELYDNLVNVFGEENILNPVAVRELRLFFTSPNTKHLNWLLNFYKLAHKKRKITSCRQFLGKKSSRSFSYEYVLVACGFAKPVDKKGNSYLLEVYPEKLEFLWDMEKLSESYYSLSRNESYPTKNIAEAIGTEKINPVEMGFSPRQEKLAEICKLILGINHKRELLDIPEEAIRNISMIDCKLAGIKISYSNLQKLKRQLLEIKRESG